MNIRDIPSQVERTHGYPVTHDDLRETLGTQRITVPDGPDRDAATLLDACAEYGFETTFETPEDLLAALYCCADATHVGRVGYDDRGGNPAWNRRDQVSF